MIGIPDNKSYYTPAVNKAVQKYVKQNYDRIMVSMPKGSREPIKEHAKKQGESLNSFVLRAIRETMERDNDPGKNE